MVLTRSQAAQRLGRSIATVRKLEHLGRLVARRGPGGKHLFDAEDVDAIREQYARTGCAFPDADHEPLRARTSSPADLFARVAQLEARERAQQAVLEALRKSVANEVEALLDAIGGRCPNAIEPLERLLRLASTTSWSEQ